MIENSSYLIMYVTCNKLDNQGLQIIKYIHWVLITLAIWRRKPENNFLKIVEIRKFQKRGNQEMDKLAAGFALLLHCKLYV